MRNRNGSTLKQMAYARRVWGAQGQSKELIARDVGYAPSVARSPKFHIEDTKGFQNAMLQLSKESNTMALTILLEFKRRGLKDFSNKDLVGALNAIGNAWSKFTPKETTERNPIEGNKLRTVILQRISTQQVNNGRVGQVVYDAPEDKEQLEKLRKEDLGF